MDGLHVSEHSEATLPEGMPMLGYSNIALTTRSFTVTEGLK